MVQGPASGLILGREVDEMTPDSRHDFLIGFYGWDGYNDEDRVQQKIISSTPFVREGHFRIMDLPAELRVHIYSFLLPHNLLLSHRQSGNAFNVDQKGVQMEWIIDARKKKSGVVVPFAMGKRLVGGWAKRNGVLIRDKLPHAQTQLFRVNKEISNEARAILYGGNTYEFMIDGSAHFPKSLSSPLIFGPFGNNGGARLHLLRNLRSIRIDFVPDTDSHWAVKRQRSRLEYFVDVLKQHFDDEDRKSLLQELYVDVRIPGDRGRDRRYSSNGNPIPLPKDSEKFLFGLESLATLRGIKDVKITGVPDWYAQCLTLVIQGKGGDVLETDWPPLEVKRSKSTGWSSKKTSKVWVTTRKWHQPTLNWKEFAQRNKVEIPDDIDKFWGADTQTKKASPRRWLEYAPDPRGV